MATKARTLRLLSSTMMISTAGAIELTSWPTLTRVLRITPLVGASIVQSARRRLVEVGFCRVAAEMHVDDIFLA